MTISTRLFTTIVLTIFCAFYVSTTSAQTIHTILFAATDDNTIGKGTEQSYEMIVEEIETIANTTNLKSELYFRTGQAFSINNYNKIIQQLSDIDVSKDVILFYFLGHGYESSSDYPNLLFKNTRGSIDREELDEASKNLEVISQELTKLGARMTIVVGEACNNEFDLDQGSVNVEDVISTMAAPSPVNASQYKRLFQYAEGSLLISSSRKGQPSYISRSEGGAFTQAFLKALSNMTHGRNTEAASWVTLATDARTLTRQIAEKRKFETLQTPQFSVIKPIRYVQPATEDEPGVVPKNKFWGKMVATVAPNKVERAFKSALKSGDFLDLESILVRQGEEGDKIKQKMLLQNPVTFYMAQAMIFEEKEDSVNSLLNYSIAYELGKANRTKRDQALIDKIINLNEKHNAIDGLNEAKNYQTWLKSKFTQYRSYYQNDISVIEDNITKLRSEIQDIEESINQDRINIENIKERIAKDEQKIEELKAEIERLDVKRSQKVEVKLESMKKQSKKTIAEIEALLDKIEREGIVDNQQKFFIDDAVVEFQFAKRNTASNLEPTAKGYRLGKHCTIEIEEATTDLMKLLLRPIKDVPDRSVLKVKIKIVGNADWKGAGAGKTLSITYTGEEDIFQEYVNKDGERKVFKIAEGEERGITNEELAFLRAYCSYNIIRNILEDYGVSDYLVQFQAVEHEQPEALEGEDPGAAYRGVDIDMTIENLFKHYVDKINELEDEQDDVKDDIRTKEREIRNIRGRIDDKREEVAEKEKAIATEEGKKQRLVKILEDAEIKQGVQSKAKKSVDKVKEIQKGM